MKFFIGAILVVVLMVIAGCGDVTTSATGGTSGATGGTSGATGGTSGVTNPVFINITSIK